MDWETEIKWQSSGQARPPWDEYFIGMAKYVATRSTCPRLSVGAVAVRDNQILATGYNGAWPGGLHCTNIGCYIVDNHCQRAVHAETNVICQAAKHGISLKGAILYCTHKPCNQCIKSVISAGIKKVIYIDGYEDRFTDEYFSKYLVKYEKKA